MPADLRPTPVARPLSEALATPGIALVAGEAGTAVTGITHDSRAVRPGDLYAALPGFTTHGARFVEAAVAAGAVAVLTDPEGAAAATATGVPVLVHDDPRSVLGECAAWVYGRPGDDLLLLGVTGTNGKTTVTYLLESGLREAGHSTGVIGTVGTRIGDTAVATVRTTPEATDVHALLAVMRERGVTAVAMEVSSHALVLGRVDGLRFDVAVFTNLTQDHLDFHGTMTAYYEAKASLFTEARADTGVVCVDDVWGRRLAAGSGIPVVTYSAGAAGADWYVERPVAGPDGSRFVVHGPGGVALDAGVRIPGRYNVANAVAAIAALVRCGVAPDRRGGRCGRLPWGARPHGAGRRLGQAFAALVDYAHTPDAVAGALDAVRPVTAGRLIAVLGCGGDRDHDKRPAMGRLAAQRADVVVVTDDNPRSEDPAAIRANVLAGAHGSARPTSARSATAGTRSRPPWRSPAPGDAVVVLGKGHEQGQEVAGVVHPFDDRDRARRGDRPHPGTATGTAGGPVIPTTVRQVAAAVAGQAHGTDDDAVVTRVVTDSRLVGPGDLFVAIAGDHHDGHDHAAAAAAAGSRGRAGRPPSRRALHRRRRHGSRPRPARGRREAPAARLHRRGGDRVLREDEHEGPARPGPRQARSDDRARGLLQQRDRPSRNGSARRRGHPAPRARDGDAGHRAHRLPVRHRRPGHRRRAQRRVGAPLRARQPRGHRGGEGRDRRVARRDGGLAVLNADDPYVAGDRGPDIRAHRALRGVAARRRARRRRAARRPGAGLASRCATAMPRRRVALRLHGEHHVPNSLAAAAVALGLGHADRRRRRRAVGRGRR